MKITMSGNLLRFSNFRNQIEVAAENVEQGIENLVAECPDLKTVLFDGEKRLRSAHRLFLNGEQLGPNQLGAKVGPSDEITILTAIAGG